MFRSIDPQKLMDTDEYAVFCELDEVVTVYRGVTSYNEMCIRDRITLVQGGNMMQLPAGATGFFEAGTFREPIQRGE